MSTIIQRYIDLTKFESLIQTSSLYLSKMSAFGDHLEGGLTARNFFSTSNAASIIDLALNGSWPTASKTEAERITQNEQRESIQKRLSQKQFHTPFGSYSSDDAERLFPACRDWLYVNCWHNSDHECAAMWKIFSHDNNSLCIFSTTERLKAAITPDKICKRLEIQQVEYIDHAIDIFPDNPLAPFISKSKPYSFEREIRVISWDPEINLSNSPNNKESGLLLLVDLTKLIEKVIISPYADSLFKTKVEDLCKNAGLNIKVEDSAMKMHAISDIYRAFAHYQTHGLGS